MIPSQWQPLANHLWQSTLFATAAWLLTLALGKNRAQIRYAVWLAASVKFLVPFSLLVDVGSHFGRHSVAAVRVSGLSSAIEQAAEPFGGTVASTVSLAPIPAAAASHPFSSWIPGILCAVWAVGFAALVFSWWRRWLGLRAALRTATPVDLPIPIEALSSPAFAEPGVFGIRRPVLLMPAGILDRLTPEELEAILAHELCHVRRRDNLATSIHMAVEAVFWFHPLVWWLGARLMEERERACDEEVVLRGSRPKVYAEGILKICELYLESPLPCVAGVTGANLKKRIEAIMAEGTALRLSIARKAALVTAAAAALAGPVVVGIWNAPAIRAQAAQAAAQAGGGAAKFEVVSIRPCRAGEADNGGRGKKGGGGRMTWSPGRLDAVCATVRALVRDAYLAYPEGKPWGTATREDPVAENPGRGCSGCGRGIPPISDRQFNEPIKGSPGWLDSDRYTIEAKTDGPATPEMMRGPMMQALLEERFHLKVHRESKDVPVYELTVAKGGHKLQPSKEGSCIGRDQFVPPERGTPLPRLCGGFWSDGKNGADMFGTTIANLCRQLSVTFDRDVIDKTGIAGLFDIHFDARRPEPPPEITAELAAGGPPSAVQKDWFSSAILQQMREALPKLGLKLESGKGAGVYLVIDHVERPTEN